VNSPSDSDSDVVLLYLTLAFTVLAVIISWGVIVWPVVRYTEGVDRRIMSLEADEELLEKEE